MEKETNNWFEALLTNSRLRIVRHSLLQILILLLSMNALNNESDVFVITSERWWGWIVFYVLLNALCYLNIYFLVPRLLLTGCMGKYKWYIVASIFVYILFSIWIHIFYGDSHGQPQSLFRTIIETTTSGLVIALIIFATSTMVLFVQWMNEQRRIGELKLATKQLELNMLKQQINPHFLFNMLNNANVLLKRAPKEASQVLFRLEELLSYQLNDSAKEFVALDSDINFLNDFLNLEKIRRDHFHYSIEKEGDSSGIKVPPLVFIPFVENAVKHNLDNENESYIHIQFTIRNGELCFRCVNSKPTVPLAKIKVGGLGLTNIRRRLELLYPGQHTLSITDDEKQFTVLLIINHLRK